MHYYQIALRQGKDFTIYNLHLKMNILFCSKMLQNQLTKEEITQAHQDLLEAKAIWAMGFPKQEKGNYYRICGGLHQILDEHKQAIDYFKKALGYYKGWYRQQIAVNLAKSYIALHQIDRAKSILQQEQFTGDWDGPDKLLRSIESNQTGAPRGT